MQISRYNFTIVFSHKTNTLTKCSCFFATLWVLSSILLHPSNSLTLVRREEKDREERGGDVVILRLLPAD
jgi:preprotein translocase subunit SecG